jgi:hypothetical protein
LSGGIRIDFVSVDAARFNALRDEWRGAASSCALSRAGLRVATVLPTFVSREFGYAFPTDDDLAGTMKMTPRTIGRGMNALDEAGLIERVTRVKRDERGEAIGRQRRIFLTMPKAEVNGQKSAEVNGQEVNGQPEVNGQKWRCERTDVCPNIPDHITPDQETGRDERKVSVYARAVPSAGRSPARPTNRPAPKNPYPYPKSWGTDGEFLAVFDRLVVEFTSDGDVGAGEIDRITGKAFDQATRERGDMPFFWSEVPHIRDSTMADWFRFRAGTLIHFQEAA